MRQEITNKEQQILNAIVDKRLFTRQEIAKELNINVNTLASHLLHLYNKLYNVHPSLLGLAFYELEKRGKVVCIY